MARGVVERFSFVDTEEGVVFVLDGPRGLRPATEFEKVLRAVVEAAELVCETSSPFLNQLRTALARLYTGSSGES